MMRQNDLYRRKNLVIFLTVLLIVYFFYGLFSAIVDSQKYLDTDHTPFPKITNQYLEIFPKVNQMKIKVSYTYYNMYKKPFSTFETIDKKFDVLVYQIDSSHNISSLPKYLNFRWSHNLDPSGNVKYNGSYKTLLYRFSDAIRAPHAISHVTIYLSQTKVKPTVENDSLIIYNVSTNDIIGRYNNDTFVEFYFKSLNFSNFNSVKSSLGFLKKGDRIFMLFLSPQENATNLDGKLLYNLIRDKMY